MVLQIKYTIKCKNFLKKFNEKFLESYFECDSGKDGHYISLTSASEKLIKQLQFILSMGFGINSEK